MWNVRKPIKRRNSLEKQNIMVLLTPATFPDPKSTRCGEGSEKEHICIEALGQAC